jgi:hypothetical protein
MITPKTPPKRSRYRGLLWKILFFDILMRLTPPLTFIALSITGVALYKSAPADTKTKAKATFNSLRSKLSDWIKPEEREEREVEEQYDFDEEGEMERKVQEAQDRDDPDDKYYPPESI